MLEQSGLEFTAFYAKYAPLVRRMLARRGVQRRDLDDVAQDAFVTIHRLLSEFEGRSSIETWLNTVTWRVAATHLRGTQRKREIPSDETVSRIADQPTGVAGASERLHAALGGLDEQQREAFVLHELSELSISELSEITGNARATIRDRIDRGRKAIGARLWRSFTNVEAPEWLDQLAPRSAARLAQLHRPTPQHAICDGNAISVLDDIVPRATSVS